MTLEADTAATLFGVTIFVGLVFLAVSAFVPAARDRVGEEALWLASFVAVAATAGSLYFSEIADFVPCKLCWFQRIGMYPLAVILPIAAVRRDRQVMRYVIPLASIGLAISLLHIRTQLQPDSSNFCALDDPCSVKWVEAFGWLTIPEMAGLCFIAIIVLGVFALRIDRRDSSADSDPDTDSVEHVDGQASDDLVNEAG